MRPKTIKQNWFSTLNDALESERLLDTWDCFNPPIRYGETRAYLAEIPGDKYMRFISIYRDEEGRYERPVHYSTGRRIDGGGL